MARLLFYCSSPSRIPSCTHPVLHTPLMSCWIFGLIMMVRRFWGAACLCLPTYLLSCLLNRCTHRGPLLDIMHFDVFWKRALGILAHGYGNDPAVKKERVRRDGKGGRKRNFSESWQSKLIHHIFKNGDTHKSPSPFL